MCSHDSTGRWICTPPGLRGLAASTKTPEEGRANRLKEGTVSPLGAEIHEIGKEDTREAKGRSSPEATRGEGGPHKPRAQESFPGLWEQCPADQRRQQAWVATAQKDTERGPGELVRSSKGEAAQPGWAPAGLGRLSAAQAEGTARLRPGAYGALLARGSRSAGPCWFSLVLGLSRALYH